MKYKTFSSKKWNDKNSPGWSLNWLGIITVWAWLTTKLNWQRRISSGCPSLTDYINQHDCSDAALQIMCQYNCRVVVDNPGDTERATRENKTYHNSSCLFYLLVIIAIIKYISNVTCYYFQWYLPVLLTIYPPSIQRDVPDISVSPELSSSSFPLFSLICSCSID